MENIAPNIKRQRLLLEGYFDIQVEEDVIREYFNTITGSLKLKTYGDPIIFCPGGEGKAENQGYDAFVPLIDSGISVYIWSSAKFFSIIIYTCKDFNEKIAFDTTNGFFKATKIVKQSF